MLFFICSHFQCDKMKGKLPSLHALQQLLAVLYKRRRSLKYRQLCEGVGIWLSLVMVWSKIYIYCDIPLVKRCSRYQEANMSLSGQ